MYQVKLAGSHKQFAHHFEILNQTIELFPELGQEDEEADPCAVLDPNDTDQGEPPVVQYSTVQYSTVQYSTVQNHLPAFP